jgi:predicted nuclease of restriction endonuclease-like RecB superfamily
VVPHFLDERDHPWLRALLDEHERFIGRHQRELEERLREPLPCASPARKRKLATHVLARVWGTGSSPSSPPPRRARAEVFGTATGSDRGAEALLEEVAGRLGVTVAALRESLYADLPGERRVGAPRETISPGELALRANLALAQALVFRSTRITIELEGNARAVVRHAKLRGLICVVTPRDGLPGAHLELSGPYALFRRTLLYGRALGQILPLLAWCQRFRLRADCILRGQEATLTLQSGDPIFPAEEPRRYDSRLEERFARDFRKLAPGWNVLREPEPVNANGTLAFPDFALEHRTTGQRWLLELAGFWTPDYLVRKLAQYRAASLPNLILCIDEDRNCASSDLPANTPVIRFRKKVDAQAVLDLVSGLQTASPEVLPPETTGTVPPPHPFPPETTGAKLPHLFPPETRGTKPAPHLFPPETRGTKPAP